MAKTVNPLFVGLRGSIGKQLVFKQYAQCTVVTKYPDMSKVIRTPLQKKKNVVFAEAVKYARGILKDPEKYKEYKQTLQPGERVYNQAIKAYLASVNKENLSSANKKTDQILSIFNTKDDRRREPINTKDERRRDTINRKDEVIYLLFNYRNSVRPACRSDGYPYHSSSLFNCIGSLFFLNRILSISTTSENAIAV